MQTESYVYLLANKHNNVLYTGVTKGLIRRVYEHKNKLVAGFTRKYNVDRLVYYEACGNYEVLIDIHTLEVVRGSMPRRALALVLEWAF